MENIISTSLVSEKRWKDKEVTLEKHIYIDCDCGDISHTARVRFYRDLERGDDGKTVIVLDDVSFDFNLSQRLSLTNWYTLDTKWKKLTYKIVYFFDRVKAAFNLVLGRPIYISSEIALGGESMMDLVEEIKKGYKEILDRSDKITFIERDEK